MLPPLRVRSSRAVAWLLLFAAAGLLAFFGLPVVRYLLPRPLVVLWLTSAAALAGLWVRRQERRRRLVLLTVSFALLTLYCLPVSSYLLCGTLESRYPPLAD